MARSSKSRSTTLERVNFRSSLPAITTRTVEPRRSVRWVRRGCTATPASFELNTGTGVVTAYVNRPDGRVLYFSAATTSGPWTSDSDVNHSLTQITQGGVAKWKLVASDNDNTEIYDVATGRLESIFQPRRPDSNAAVLDGFLTTREAGWPSVTDAFGRAISFLLRLERPDLFVPGSCRKYLCLHVQRI